MEWVARVFGAAGERGIVVVDFPQDPAAFEIETTVIALAVRIILRGEGVERSHVEERRKLELRPELADAPGDHDAAVADAMLAEPVVELRDPGRSHGAPAVAIGPKAQADAR